MGALVRVTHPSVEVEEAGPVGVELSSCIKAPALLQVEVLERLMVEQEGAGVIPAPSNPAMVERVVLAQWKQYR